MTARARLLEQVVEHLLAHGLGDASLRRLASAVGTSHRMLLYHFGSRDGLLAAAVDEVERRQLAALGDLVSAEDPAAAGRRMSERLADPALAPLERLFFELYGRGLNGDEAVAGWPRQAVESWLDPLVAILVGYGLDAETARAEATLSLATSRGLLLDLLATGDRDRYDAAGRLALDAFMLRLERARSGR
jgi:AcrR family transcriptional regulator